MSSTLNFTRSEIRLATATLATLLVVIPAIHYLQSPTSQETTPHVKTFRKYLQAYSTKRPQALAANASRDFTHIVLPSALKMPTRTLAPFKTHAAIIFSLFESFQMRPQPPGHETSVHFCKETNTVVTHCTMGGRINGESEKGRLLIEQGLSEWWTECVLFVRMDEEGHSVLEVKEFVDSAKAAELKKRLEGIFEG